MQKIFFFFILIAISYNSFSQSAEDSVKKVINKMFKAMKNSDGKMLQECFGDSALLQTITTASDGKVVVKNQEVKSFVSQVASLEEGSVDERIIFDGIKVDQELAIAWTPYRFYYKKNFIHCGINSFQLVRINGNWKIQYIIDTRRKDNCK